MAIIPFNRPAATGPELEYIRQAIENAHLSGDGPFTKACHAILSERLAPGQALLTHSCTAALELACLLADLGPGDEVILPSYTFVSTANAAVLRGATPVFVDIRRDTLNIDEKLVEQAITPRTRAIMAVHYAGVVAEMDALREVARRHGLIVIEDAAQAYLSTYNGEQAGRLSDMACFSFHETKNIISGEGGAFVTANPELYARAEIVREKGTNRRQFLRGAVDKYSWVDVGSSFLPSEIVAAFLRAQLEAADRITAARLALWDRYYAGLADLEAAGLATRPTVPQHCQHNAHMFYLLLGPSVDRGQVIDTLKQDGIQVTSHYVPLHSSLAGRRYGRVAGQMDVTDAVAESLIRLPMYASLDRDIDRVIERVHLAIDRGAA